MDIGQNVMDKTTIAMLQNGLVLFVTLRFTVYNNSLIVIIKVFKKCSYDKNWISLLNLSDYKWNPSLSKLNMK